VPTPGAAILPLTTGSTQLSSGERASVGPLSLPGLSLTSLADDASFFGRLDDDTFREAYAFLPQGGVGDALNKCMIQLEESFDPEIKQVLGQTHDSVMGQVRTEKLEDLKEEVIAVFEQELPMECQGIKLRIPCEFFSGRNWKECG